jgi:uncharacterized protein (TIGR00369 family)
MSTASHQLHDEIAATLERWRADEARVLAHLAAPGISRPEQVMDKTGLQMFEAIRDGVLPSVPIGAALDFVPIEFEPGRMVFQGHPSARFCNPMGSIHGGWIATLLDSAVACAVHTTLPAGRAYTTAELKVSYLRALMPDVPLVRAEGKIISAGRQVGFAEGRLYGPDGRLYAHATTTCVVLQQRV